MPYGEVKLIPGVNTERTPTLNEAGVSQSQLIRYKDTLVQKLGGWTKFFNGVLSGRPRDLHAWEDLNGTTHLGYGSTSQLGVITSGNYTDVTPQTKTSDFLPAFQATANSTTITITDTNISSVTTYDSVILNVPMSVGGAILSGVYPIVSIVGANTFTIQNATAAATTNTLVSNATTNLGSTVLNFTTVPSWVTTGMVVVDVTTQGAATTNSLVVSTTATTITLSTALVHTAPLGDSIVITSLPRFSAAVGNGIVGVQLMKHGLSQFDTIVFPIPTTNASAGFTISGVYPVTATTDANNFTITVPTQSATTISYTMNNGLAELVYYITLGPAAIGAGYGSGAYGAGGYGTGVTSSSQTGTPITSTDWTLDNWGQLLVGCPSGGGIYVYDPTGAFTIAQFVNTAPPYNGGAFVSTSQQMLVCWATTVKQTIGIQQDPMLVAWSDIGDYTQFTPLTSNQAGNFRIPIGSMIVGGMATPNQNLIWTDLDLWSMNYQGQPFVWGFNKIGAGAGLVSAHAMEALRGGVYWMSQRNFYAFDGQGVRVLPCPVWDFVFQNINTTYLRNVRAVPNTPFNEVGWEFPSSSSTTGECDSYVKFNLVEQGAWDFGTLARSAAIDQTVLGMPIQATPTGIIYQHEISNDADGQPLMSSFTTGYFYLSQGEDFVFVDQVLPDFKWGAYGSTTSAQVQLSFNVINYPGDTPNVYGPYTVTSSTQYLSVRFRGRQVSITVASSDVGSFWRLGKVRFRFAPAGRR